MHLLTGNNEKLQKLTLGTSDNFNSWRWRQQRSLEAPAQAKSLRDQLSSSCCKLSQPYPSHPWNKAVNTLMIHTPSPPCVPSPPWDKAAHTAEWSMPLPSLCPLPLSETRLPTPTVIHVSTRPAPPSPFLPPHISCDEAAYTADYLWPLPLPATKLPMCAEKNIKRFFNNTAIYSHTFTCNVTC